MLDISRAYPKSAVTPFTFSYFYVQVLWYSTLKQKTKTPIIFLKYLIFGRRAYPNPRDVITTAFTLSLINSIPSSMLSDNTKSMS